MQVIAEYIFKSFPAAKERLDGWFGELPHKVLQGWEDSGNIFLVVKTDSKLHFLRMFQIGDRMEISVDNEHTL